MSPAQEKSRLSAPQRDKSSRRRAGPGRNRGAAQVSRGSAEKPQPPSQWTFLTNHAHVLVLLDRNPSIVLREVSIRVGITERAVQRIVADLQAAGIVECTKVGRQNQYRIMADKPLRHPIESDRMIEELLSLFRIADEQAHDVPGFSAMRNHRHVVIRNQPEVLAGWSPEEIARRWWELFPLRRDANGVPPAQPMQGS